MKSTLQTEQAKDKQDIVSPPKLKEEEPELKGAFWSVLFLAVFLIGSWFGVYLLYLQRM